MNAILPAKVIEKFWASTNKTTFCWNWAGFLDKNKSPIIRISDPKFAEFSPRRVSLMLAGKELLDNNPVFPLMCKNQLCVNPDHLVSGDESRFWAKVQKLSNDGCWVWTAGYDKDMYGKFRLGGKDIRAHVYSWQLYIGRPVPKGLQICHTCDHPYCVNPAHLFLGTTQDNAQDKVNKNRHPRGSSHGNSKLSEIQVKEIRELFRNGKTTKQLSQLFKVTASSISGIILQKSWRHII